MGCCMSSSSLPENTKTPTSQEQSKSLAKGKETGPKKAFDRRTSAANNGIMQSVAMKFPHIRRSFHACKRVFDKYSQNRDCILKSEMRTILIELGAKESELSDKEIDELFKTSNLDGDNTISFKEFLIAAAVGCFLKKDPDQQSEEFQTIQKGFKVVQDAFSKIDRDGSGEIDFEELKAAFLSMRQDDLINERLRELDFNGDRTIEFPEFVFGLSAWVGMDDYSLDDDETSPQPNNVQFQFESKNLPKENDNNNDNNNNTINNNDNTINNNNNDNGGDENENQEYDKHKFMRNQ